MCSREDIEIGSFCVIELKLMIPLSQLLTIESTGGSMHHHIGCAVWSRLALAN